MGKGTGYGVPPMPVPPGMGGLGGPPMPPGGPPIPPPGAPLGGAPPTPAVPQPQSAKALPVDTRGLLLVGNLSAEVSDEKVEKLLVASLGTDGESEVQWRRADPAFGFAELPTAAHAVRAAQLLNNLQLGKCTLYCCMDEKTKTQLKDWTLTKSAELAQKI